MFTDNYFSRFKIKAKVMIVVLPFVITISAVGLTGLYASKLLPSPLRIGKPKEITHLTASSMRQ